MSTSVLVVEDDRAQRDLLRRWLEHWGYAVRVAASAGEALALMLVEPAEILLVDIVMPGPNGLWLIERVRAKWSTAIVVVVSGLVERPTVERAQKLGAVDYVTKPFGREMLRQAMDRAEAALAKHRGEDGH